MRNLQLNMPPKTKGRRRLPPWVGPWLREHRPEGVELDDIARRLKRSKSAVSRIETGHSVISADDLPLILKAYGQTLEAFTAEARRTSKAA